MKLDKKGRGDLEKGITLVGGISIIIFFVYTLFSAGIASEIIKAFSSAFSPFGFGALGGFLGFLFIIMVIIAMFANLRKKL